MSKASFLNFHGLPKKTSTKSPQLSISKVKETQNSNVSRDFRPNMEEMRRVFEKFDTNQDGKISKEEYKTALTVLGKEVAKDEMDKSFHFIDIDKDGFIDFKEFMEMMLNDMGDEAKKNDIKGAFQVFDLNGDKKISAEELREVLKRMGGKYSLDACKKMIKGVDADGDGLIDMDEFMTMMTRT